MQFHIKKYVSGVPEPGAVPNKNLITGKYFKNGSQYAAPHFISTFCMKCNEIFESRLCIKPASVHVNKVS
jgi:hypothetical protein